MVMSDMYYDQRENDLLIFHFIKPDRETMVLKCHAASTFKEQLFFNFIITLRCLTHESNAGLRASGCKGVNISLYLLFFSAHTDGMRKETPESCHISCWDDERDANNKPCTIQIISSPITSRPSNMSCLLSPIANQVGMTSTDSADFLIVRGC